MRVPVIIVVSWNNTDDVIECANSLLAQSIPIKIIIIDNDSERSASDQLKAYAQQSEKIDYINTGYNGGTAGGFNAGIRWAIDHNYDYVGTLNADAIADKQWAEMLVSELSSYENCGISTGILARRDGKTIDTTGDFYTTWGIPGPRLRDAPIDQAPKESGEIFGSSGGGFIARTTLFSEIGLFDEAYFMYFEDVDLSFRAQLAGWRVRYTPEAIAYHKLGASSSTVPGLAVYNTFKNLPMLFTKNVPLSLWPTIYPRFVLSYTLILMNAIRNGRGAYALKGWLKSWLLVPHMFRKRWHVQRTKKVSSRYISSIILHDIPPEQTGLRKMRKVITGRL